MKNLRRCSVTMASRFSKAAPRARIPWNEVARATRAGVTVLGVETRGSVVRWCFGPPGWSPPQGEQRNPDQASQGHGKAVKAGTARAEGHALAVQATGEAAMPSTSKTARNRARKARAKRAKELAQTPRAAPESMECEVEVKVIKPAPLEKEEIKPPPPKTEKDIPAPSQAGGKPPGRKFRSLGHRGSRRI